MAERSRNLQIADRAVAFVTAIFATVGLVVWVSVRFPPQPEWVRTAVMVGGLFGFGFSAFQWRAWWHPVLATAIAALLSALLSPLNVAGHIHEPFSWALPITVFLAGGILLVMHFRRRTS